MKKISIMLLGILMSFLSFSQNVVYSEDFESGMGTWSADQTWNVAEISTDIFKSGTASLEGRRNSDKWSNHGLIGDLLGSVQCYGDGAYKLKFSIYLASGFDRNTDLTIFKNGDSNDKDYGTVVAGIDNTLTGVWQDIEVDFTLTDVAVLTGLAINIGTWGGTASDPGIPIYIDDVQIITTNESTCSDPEDPTEENGNIVIADDFEDGIGNWTADQSWNIVEIATDPVASGSGSLEARRDDENWSDQGAHLDLTEAMACYGDGDYKLTFKIYLSEAFDRNLECHLFYNNAPQESKIYATDNVKITNADGVGQWLTIERNFTVTGLADMSQIGLRFYTYGGTASNPGNPFWIDDLKITTENEKNCPTVDFDGVLVDYSANQIASNDQEEEKVVGDIWARDTNNVIALEIIDATEGPAGYNLSEKILKVNAGEYVNWWDGLMFEFNPVTVNLESKKYLHVAYYLPKLSSDDGGAIRNWLKGGGVQRWNYKEVDQPATIGTWVDLVYDITNDSIDGLSIDHFEFFGFPRNETSYLGSVILSESSEPRIAVPEPTVPDAPTGLFGEATSNTEIALGWTDNSADETMFIVKQKDGDNWAGIANLDANTTSATISNLEMNTTYTFVIVALNDVGESENSNEITISTLNTGVRDILSTSNCIYPNPVNEKLNISTENVTKWMITNLSGKQIMTGVEKQVEVSSLVSGMYFIQMEKSNGEIIVNRFIKN